MLDEHGVLGLATIRRNRGISLHQIAETTKISVRSLEAIERGEFKKLPGGIYNTNYIKQYARAIDYDEAPILAFYYRAIGETDDTPRSTSNTKGKGLFGGYRPASSAAR
jgi:cytoskeletal protein RodZ